MSDFALSRIAVAMLGVTDLARSVAFYRDTLGLSLQSEIPGEFAFFNAGSVTLALSVPHTKHTGRGAGATEVVFSVEGVREAYDSLRARGVRFTNEPRNVTGPMWGANFSDPDGHGLSLFGPERKP